MEHQHTIDDYEDLAKEKLEDGGLLKAQANRMPDVRLGQCLVCSSPMVMRTFTH